MEVLSTDRGKFAHMQFTAKQPLVIHEFGPVHSLGGNARKLEVTAEECVTVGWDFVVYS